MKIDVCGLEKAIFEVVQVEEYTVFIKLGLRIALAPIHLVSATNLDVGQLANGAEKEFLLGHIVSSAGIAATLDGIKQRGVSQVGLQVSHLVVAHGQQAWHGQLLLDKLPVDTDKSTVLVYTGAHYANHGVSVGICHAVILAIAARPGHFLDVGRRPARP